MHRPRILAVMLAAILFSGCAAVTITESGQPDFRYRPHYEQTKHFFLWGLIGEHTVNTRKVCGKTPVAQMQTKFKGYDVLFATLTGGLYLPRTAMVWCKREDVE
ncbi:MAG: Bor family protein [Oleiphilaceae bacterium]|nr:Bor family protein [Oleiphilaceae bacterium]